MKQRRNNSVLVKILLCLLGALMAVFALACTGETGPQGPQGVQGPQGEQGPQGDPGANADLDSVAFVVFQTNTDEAAVDPVLIEKGSTITLPEISRQGYSFQGWYHGTGKEAVEITEETPIEQSMTISAKWRAEMAITGMDDGVTAGENLYFWYSYAETKNVRVSLEKITWQGVDYTPMEAIKKNIIKSNYDMTWDYYSDYEEYEGVIRFIKSGTFTLHIKSNYGATLAFDVEIKPVEFDGVMSISQMSVPTSSLADFPLMDGTVLNLVEGDGTNASFFAQAYAPYGTDFSVTINGEEGYVDIEDDSNPNWTLYVDGSLGESNTFPVGESVITVKATHEYYGEASLTLTVNVAPAPTEIGLMYHGWNDVFFVGDTTATLTEYAQVYIPDDVNVATQVEVNVLDAEGVIVEGVSISSNEGGKSQNRLLYTATVTGIDTLPAGKYTLATKLVNSEEKETVLLEWSAEFYVVEEWVLERYEYTYYTETPGDLVYTYAGAAQSITVEGVTVSVGETKEFDFVFGGATASLSYDETANKTTLSFVLTANKTNDDYGISMFTFTTTVGGASFKTAVDAVEIQDVILMKMEAAMELWAQKYVLETYFAEEIESNENVKAFYELLSKNILAMSMDEIDALYEDVYVYYENPEFQEMMNAKLPTDSVEEIEARLEEARANVRENTAYGEELIPMIDMMAFYRYPFSLFDETVDWTEAGSFASMITFLEGKYLAEGGVLIAEEIYLTMRLETTSVPSEFVESVENVVAARTAWLDAAIEETENVTELRDAYVAAMKVFLEIFYELEFGGVVPIIRVL